MYSASTVVFSSSASSTACSTFGPELALMNRFRRSTLPPASHSRVLFRSRWMKSRNAGDSSVRDSVHRFGRFPASLPNASSSASVRVFITRGWFRP